MSSFEQRWTRLTAAAREAAAGEPVPAPAGAWVTRIGALGAAEIARSRATSWLAWAVPGCGVALLVALAAVLSAGSSLAQPESTSDLIALADPLTGNSFAP